MDSELKPCCPHPDYAHYAYSGHDGKGPGGCVGSVSGPCKCPGNIVVRKAHWDELLASRPEPPRREAEIEAALFRTLASQWRERLRICTPPDFIVEDDARKRELSMIRADIAYFDAQAAALTPAKGKEK
jgi:hypothetical protein